MHNGLEPPEIDMLKEQNETAEQESNLFTIVGEHIPSPPEIEAEDVLVLPEIQSMTDYIRLHFEEKLVEELSRSLRCGELVVPSGGRLYQELPGQVRRTTRKKASQTQVLQSRRTGFRQIGRIPDFLLPACASPACARKKGPSYGSITAASQNAAWRPT